LVPWSDERVQAVIEALPDRYRAIAVLAVGCGLRRGGLFGLAVDDVDFLPGIVHVRRQVKLVSNRRVFAPPKGGRERDIPLPESVALRLAAALKEYPARAVTLPWGKPAGELVTARLVSTNADGNAIHGNTFDTRVWKPALVKAGVISGRKVSAPSDGLHALRHYHASALLAGGVDIRTLSEQLGHADPAFTLRVYCHLMPSGAERTRAAIDRLFGASSASAPDVPRGSQQEAATQVTTVRYQK
jgi:integrase